MQRARTQAQAKRVSIERNKEKRESGTIQDVLDKSALFPCELYEIEYVEILRELINIHPATLYLMYKIATYEKPEEIIKFPIPIYRVKANWHAALKHFKKMRLVDFKDIELHVIEPHKALLTTLGRDVVKKWKNSPLFKAFKVIDTLNFKSTNHFESVFNDNFVAYKGKEGNVFYSEGQKVSSDSKLISRTKTKSSIKIIIDSGFSNDKYEYYIEEKKYNKLVSDDVTISIKLEERGLKVTVSPNFRNGNFDISVLYNNDFAESSFNLQNNIDLTNVFIERRKRKFDLINLNRTKSKVRKKKKVQASISEGLETLEKREERKDFEVANPQQTEFTGSFDPSLISESKLAEVRQSIENAIFKNTIKNTITNDQVLEEELFRISQGIMRGIKRQPYRKRRPRLIQSDGSQRVQFNWFIMRAYDAIAAEYVENLSVIISKEEVRQKVSKRFSKSCARLRKDDVKFYSNMFRRYLKDDFDYWFAGIVSEIQKKRKKRKEDLIKKLRLNFVQSITSSYPNLSNQNQLIDSNISVQPDREEIWVQEEVEAPRLANLRLKLTILPKLLIDLGKYVLKNAILFGIAGCALYLLFYKISIAMYFVRYKIDLVLSLDWELPYAYVFAKFPEMELASCIVGACAAVLPVVILVCKKTYKTLKELKFNYIYKKI